MPRLRVTIGRLLLSDLALTPAAAEQVRRLVETELGNRLLDGGLPLDPAGGEVARLRLPALPLATGHPAAGQFADGLARRLAAAVRATAAGEEGAPA